MTARPPRLTYITWIEFPDGTMRTRATDGSWSAAILNAREARVFGHAFRVERIERRYNGNPVSVSNVTAMILYDIHGDEDGEAPDTLGNRVDEAYANEGGERRK